MKRTSIPLLEENVKMYKRELNDRQQETFTYITKLRGIYSFLIITLKIRSLLRLPKKKLQAVKDNGRRFSEKFFFHIFIH